VEVGLGHHHHRLLMQTVRTVKKGRLEVVYLNPILETINRLSRLSRYWILNSICEVQRKKNTVQQLWFWHEVQQEVG